MKFLKLAAAAGLMLASVPALAQTAAEPNDTLKEVIAKGTTLNVTQMSITGNVNYKADGTFSGFDGQYEGTYKIDGSKLCITAPAVGADNACTEYPAGKKSGDTFKVTDPGVGEIVVTIR